MMCEAIRAYLVGELGMKDAAEWPQTQVMEHMEGILRSQVRESDNFEDTLDNFWERIKPNIMAVNDVLSEDLQS